MLYWSTTGQFDLFVYKEEFQSSVSIKKTPLWVPAFPQQSWKSNFIFYIYFYNNPRDFILYYTQSSCSCAQFSYFLPFHLDFFSFYREFFRLRILSRRVKRWPSNEIQERSFMKFRRFRHLEKRDVGCLDRWKIRLFFGHTGKMCRTSRSRFYHLAIKYNREIFVSFHNPELVNPQHKWIL